MLDRGYDDRFAEPELLQEVSTGTRDLVRQLMGTDPKARPTAGEALMRILALLGPAAVGTSSSSLSSMEGGQA